MRNSILVIRNCLHKYIKQSVPTTFARALSHLSHADRIQRRQPVDGDVVGVLGPGGQQGAGGVQLDGVDA